MSQRNKLMLLLLVGAVAFASVWMWSTYAVGLQTNKKPTLSEVRYSKWDERYIIASPQPLGLLHWNVLLSQHIDSTQQLLSLSDPQQLATLPISTIQPVFLFIGERFSLLKEETEQILAHVKSGAQLFISCDTLETTLLHRFFDSTHMSFFYDTTISITAPKKTYNFTARFQDVPVAKSWWGYRKLWIKNDKTSLNQTRILSHMGGVVNSLSISYGKGTIYVNTTPELFTNYQMLSKDGYAYSQVWLKHFPKNAPIYWLEFARYVAPKYNDYDDGEQLAYLQFIFDDRMRMIALLLACLGVVLFMVFRARRMHPIVPILSPKRNMSLIFANTVSSIYFNHRQTFSMIKLQRINFFHIVYKHFHIDLSTNRSPNTIKKLAQKAKVHYEVLSSILNKLDTLSEETATEENLTNLRKDIIRFYHQSGVVPTRIRNKIQQHSTFHPKQTWISGLYLSLSMFLFTLGTYLLVDARGIGILFWIIGCIPLVLGILRLQNVKPSHAQATIKRG